jgi:hypothetical protein
VEWQPGDRPHECSYCLYDGHGHELGCDSYDSNQPPVADADGPYAGTVGQIITLDASGSTDPDGTVAFFRWDVDDDGEWDTGWLREPVYAHIYTGAYAGDARVQVYDDDGASDSALAEVTITPNDAPVPDAGGPYSTRYGVEITLNASASHDPDGTITGYRWDWTNDETWDTDWLAGPVVGHTYATEFHGKVRLEVMDDGGVTRTAYATINANRLGDADGDLDTDLADYARLQHCFAVSPVVPECSMFDFDDDGSIDLADYVAFSAELVGP